MHVIFYKCWLARWSTRLKSNVNNNNTYLSLRIITYRTLDFKSIYMTYADIYQKACSHYTKSSALQNHLFLMGKKLVFTYHSISKCWVTLTASLVVKFALTWFCVKIALAVTNCMFFVGKAGKLLDCTRFLSTLCKFCKSGNMMWQLYNCAARVYDGAAYSDECCSCKNVVQ